MTYGFEDKSHFDFKQQTKGCRNSSVLKEHWMLSKRTWVQFLAPAQCLPTICDSSFIISDSPLASDCTRDAHANVHTSRHTPHMQKEVLKRGEGNASLKDLSECSEKSFKSKYVLWLKVLLGLLMCVCAGMCILP